MAYSSLELGQAGNPPCPNGWEKGATLICPKSTRLALQISNEAVFVQLGIMPEGIGGQPQWQDEQPFLPVIAFLARNFDAVRVRNYTPGAEAQVLLSVEGS
jgi:hypothetical protein